MTHPRGVVPEKPESDRTRRRAFLIAGALLVAGAAIALGLAQCDKGPTPPEGKPDPGPSANEPPGLAPAQAPAAPPATAVTPPSVGSVPAPRSSVTRVVGVVEAPAGSGSRFVVRGVAFFREFDAKGKPQRGSGMTPQPDGRTWIRDVEGVGPFALLLGFTWDTEERTHLERFTVDAATGSEVRVPLRPRIEEAATDAPPRVRWTLNVVDERGHPVEGAGLKLTVRIRNSGSPVPGAWTSDARGEALVEVPAGDYYIAVSRPGFGTVAGKHQIVEGGRATVALPRATARLRVRLVRAAAGEGAGVSVDLRSRPTAADDWQAAGRKSTILEADELTFEVPESWEHILYASGRGLAYVAVRVAPFSPDALEKTVDLKVDAGEDVEVRGLDGIDLPDHTLVQIQYEGPIGQVLTAHSEVKKVEGTWRFLHVAAEAGKVKLRVGDRDYRGALPAAGDRPRVVELR
jgi:hypothetical protein